MSVAADRGDTLPILTGVRVEIEGDKMTLLATDRYRLAMRELTWNPADSAASHIVLVPARTLADTARSLGASGSIDVALGSAAGGDGLVGFEAGSRRTTTRLLDGEYPKVSSIFPSSSETEAVISTAELVEAVKRVALVAERNTPVRLRFTEGQVAIEAGTGEDAQASEAVEADAHRSRHRGRLQPAASCSTASAPSAPTSAGSRSPSRSARPSSAGRPRPTARPTRATATSSCRCASRADAASA